VIRRLCWAVFGLTVAFVAGSIGLDIAIRGAGYAGRVDAFLAPLLVMMAGFAAVGALVATRRPENRIGWLFLVAGSSFAAMQLASQYAYYALIVRHGDLPLGIWAAWVGDELFVPSVAVNVVLVLVYFPDGRAPSARFAWVGRTAVAATVAVLAIGVVQPGTMSDPFGAYHNPLGVQAAAPLVTIAVPIAAVLVACWPLALLSLVVRYRRGTSLERTQVRWFAAAAIAMPLAFPFAGAGTPAGIAVWAAAVMGLPAAIGLAIFRHRLYDIDLIIRRTLVYTVLVAALALVYVGGIYAIGSAAQSVAHASGTVAVTFSTLAVAALFQPLRSRVQRAVDHRFARAAYDAEAAAAAFSARLRDELDVDAVAREMLTVVAGTVQPAHAGLWLRTTGARG
jgi:hypothetical protein